MQVAQQRHLPTRQEHTADPWSNDLISPRSTISNRINQPLTFSIDNYLSEKHLTRLELCSKNLRKIDKLPNNIQFDVVLLDHNEINKVEHLDTLTRLIQLSISHNRLIDIRLIGRLKTLQKLDLSNNSLDSIDCLKTLQNLIMLNISSNNIHSLCALNHCSLLQSVDASENSIRQIDDLSHLTTLKYLNLRKNLIDTIVTIPKHWPKSIHTLLLSDNEIQDLTEISCLSTFINLNTLFISDNPCLFIVNDRYGCHQPFDYRPYIRNWCLSIHYLDGMGITRKESLKAEWLFSQGKGQSFKPGQHSELVQYLIKVCGTDADERDDLHLSRVMYQEDLYKQNHDDDVFLETSDTLKDANDTLLKDGQTKLQQSLLVSESEFVRITPSSSVTIINEEILSDHHQTPSPIYNNNRSNHSNDERSHEHNFANRYFDYDNRPIKPLDRNMLQTKLEQYPIDDQKNITRPRIVSNPQQPIKRASPHLAYNAHRHSPKLTIHGPTTSTVTNVSMRPKANKDQTNRKKRHTIAADNVHTFHLEDHTRHHASTSKAQHRSQPNKAYNDDDDDEIQLKSAPVNGRMSRSNTIGQNNTVELKKLTISIEAVRTSTLQAYLDLHERFTKTTELQTSALSALWKMIQYQKKNYEGEIQKLTEENRLLNKRLQDVESRSNIKSQMLHPPLNVYISKRDTRSFFLNWIPNPSNEQQIIHGYRIYIDNVLKYTVEPGKFNEIIDCIRDEGEYRIKVRTYNHYGESNDSNVVVTRFRRQNPTQSDTKTMFRTKSDQIIDDSQQENLTKIPLRHTQSEENFTASPTEQIKSPIIMNKQREHTDMYQTILSSGFSKLNQSSSQSVTTNENINVSSTHSNFSNPCSDVVPRKPPFSPSSSPNKNDSTRNNVSCNKVLLNENTNESSTTTVTQRSPTRTGIISRLTRSPHKIKRNNALLNALPIHVTSSPTEVANSIKHEVDSSDRSVNNTPSQVDSSNDQDQLVSQQLPMTPNIISKSMTIESSSGAVKKSFNEISL